MTESNPKGFISDIRKELAEHKRAIGNLEAKAAADKKAIQILKNKVAALERGGDITPNMLEIVKKIIAEQAAQQTTLQEAADSLVHAGKGKTNG